MEDSKNGFGLIGLLLLGLIASIVIFGVTYFSPTKEKKSVIERGIEAEKEARALKERIEFEHKSLQRDFEE